MRNETKYKYKYVSIFPPFLCDFVWAKKRYLYNMNSINKYKCFLVFFPFCPHLSCIEDRADSHICCCVITLLWRAGCVCDCAALSYLMESCADNNRPTSTTVQPFAAINSSVTKCQHWWRNKTNGWGYLFEFLIHNLTCCRNSNSLLSSFLVFLFIKSLKRYG